MMKNRPSKSIVGSVGRLLPTAAVAFLVAVSITSAQDAARPVKRAAAEVAVGGITLEERLARQATLHAQIMAEMPNEALDDLISVELTQQDRDHLAEPYVSGTPLRIGVVKAISPSIEIARGKGFNSGDTQETADGGFVWAVTVTSPEAKAIRVHFTDFSLPPNVEMYFYSPDGAADGPYVGAGRDGNGDFWTRSIGSDTGVIQLRYDGAAARGARERISFVVSELGHIHDRQHLQPGQGSVAHHDPWPCADNVPCLVDANCVSGTPADPAKDAVGKMEWIISPYVYTCTGGLLVDTVPATEIPYFLTANHCFDASIANLETWFNYTTDSCNGMCPHNILTGGAPPSDTVGITVVASNATSDFTLGILDEDPPAGAVFLGWNTAPVAFTNGAPLYRISNANLGPQVYSQQDVDTSSPVCGGLPRGNIIYSQNNTGGTMGGSSGSPVVNADSEVVGQLYGCCGYNCANDCDFVNNWTIDGAFAVTWPSVEQYLDPGGCTSDKECNDEVYCNGLEWCDIPSGNCQPGTPPNCNDGVGCTDDSCNEGTDSCDNIPNDANCDDTQYCNGAETCHVTLDCQLGTPPNCSDGVGCTDDSCNEGTDSCDNIPNDANCDDTQYCNGSETCHATLDCQPGTAVDCNDGVGCTDDSCNESTDSCDNIPNDANCDDDLFCNGAETCHATLDCQAGTDPCPGQVCLEATDECVDCTGDPDCDDGVFCNGAETCVGGNCQADTPPNCSDSVGCTDDSCNEGTDSCDNIPNDALCADTLYCNGVETCHATLDCQPGTAVDCNDGVGCTDDSCNESTDSCDNIANDANCPDDGQFCNGTEFCDAVNDCDHTGDPCLPSETCNEVTDTCEGVECTVPADCDDGSDCTTDTCVDNVCYNDCAATVSSYPYTEGFESGWGDWVNATGDDMDWTRNSGSTPSSSTGPSGAHGGTYYIYTEASSPNYPNKTAILEGPCFDLSNTSDADMTFWYHMYGSAMGTLNVEVSEDCIVWDNVWNLSGNQGNTWYEASVDLSAYIGTTVTIRFRGITGSSYTSDMSVDDIAVDVTPAIPCSGDPDCDDGLFCNGAEVCIANLCEPGSDPCPGQACDEDADTCYPAECTVDGDCDDLDDCTVDTCVDYVCYNDCPSTVTSYPYNEGFESGWGDWVNVTGDDMDWTRNSGSTPSSSTGPSSAHGGTFYIYTEASSPNYPNKTAILDGPCFDLTNASDAQMTFWYHMYGSAMGTLYLEASENCVSWATVWSLSGNQGNAWYEAVVDLSAYDGARLSLRLRGVTGSSYTSDMSVDDISVTATVGPICSVPADCDDGVYCNGAEDCVGGNCVPGTAVDCNDGVGCTDDSCNEGTDSCDNVANDANCDDAQYCNGDEWCDAVSDCQPGTVVDCNDGVACTDDSCNEGTDSCDNVANDANCADGEFCNGAEWCDAVSDCQPGSDPCAGFFGCDEVNDVCVECFVDGDCDDGLYCNGVETCDALGVCQAGTAVDCNDGVGCTDDSCNETTDSCDNIANDANCDDGQYCNGDEWCDAVSDCQPGTAVDCDDLVGCTDDSCNEGTDSCDNIANDANCDNGLYCDGAEWCDAVLDCQAGTAVDCDDGVGCTDDSCNEGSDSCDNVANDTYCPDDGLFCNGTEYCDAVADCSSTGDPCSGGEICNEETDTCDPGDAAKMEAGTATVGGSPVTVNLTNTYASPVVVCSVEYYNNSTPIVARVTGVTSTSFDVYLQNPSGGGVSSENVSYLVVEEGTWTIDGVNVEAQTYLSTVTDENNSWVGEAQTYGQSYANPVVVGQVMSDNDPMWSVFWCQGTSRGNPPSAGALKTGKTVCEDTDTTRANETIGFIVFEAGHGKLGGVEFEALVGADTVRGVTNAPPYTYTFSTAFGSAPTVAVTTMAGVDGGNGGWSYTYGANPTTTSTLDLVIDEDQVGDSERNHTTEQVGYVVFQAAAVYP